MIHKMPSETEEDSPRWYPIGTWRARVRGVITIFEKGAFYGSPRDAVIFGRKPRNRHKFGDLIGFVIGEVIWGDSRINFEFFQGGDERDKRRRDRKKALKYLKNRGIRRWQYEKYLKANPLDRYFEGKPVKYPPTEEEVKEHLRNRFCSKCGAFINRRLPGYKLKPVSLCQDCNRDGEL